MKVNSDDFKFILQTLNRIDNDAEVEFQGNAWRDGEIEYKSLDACTIIFTKKKNDNAKLIIKIS